MEIKIKINGAYVDSIGYDIEGDEAEIKAFLDAIASEGGDDPVDPVDPVIPIELPYVVQNGDVLANVVGLSDAIRASESGKYDGTTLDISQVTEMGQGDYAGLLSGSDIDWGFSTPVPNWFWKTSYNGFAMGYNGVLGGTTFRNHFDNCTNLHSAFRELGNPTTTTLMLFNTDKVSNWDACFYKSQYIKKINSRSDALKFDSYNGEGAEFIFQGCDALKEVWITNCPAEFVEQLIEKLPSTVKEECKQFIRDNAKQ